METLEITFRSVSEGEFFRMWQLWLQKGHAPETALRLQQLQDGTFTLAIMDYISLDTCLVPSQTGFSTREAAFLAVGRIIDQEIVTPHLNNDEEKKRWVKRLAHNLMGVVLFIIILIGAVIYQAYFSPVSDNRAINVILGLIMVLFFRHILLVFKGKRKGYL